MLRMLLAPTLALLLALLLPPNLLEAREIDAADNGVSIVLPVAADAVLEGEITEVLRNADGAYGVAVKSLRDDRTLAINADKPLSAASLYKLLVAYRAYKEVEKGQLSMDETITILGDDAISSDPGDDIEVGSQLTVGDALHAMITWSSNDAALALVRVTGGWEGVLSSAEGAGVHMEVRDDQFWISPEDFVGFYEGLFTGTLLDRPYSDQLITQLLAQEKKDRIPALLPVGATVAHKTGELDDTRNDAGVVFTPHGGYIIVLMANDADPDEETAAEAKISKLVYDSYQAD